MDKKYVKLYKEIKEKILSGEYPGGKKLPSKRVMADLHGVSVITVEAAYDVLIDEGYITPRERSGYFVSAINHYIQEKNTAKDTISYLDDPTGVPDTDFEYSVWFKTVRRVISEKGSLLFIKSPVRGCAVLRNAIADYLYRYRGMHAEPKNIIIGSGSEQLYEIAIKILGRNKIYGIESPCYEQIPTIYHDMGAAVCSLDMGNDGIVSDALKKGEFDVLHVTPFHSYPSGITASISKRYEYLDWANQNGNYIIEDDFDSEFFIPGNPIESLYKLNSGKSVIYINTFSKSLSPAMRLGYMILPDELLPLYDAHLGSHSCSVPVMDQYILAEFISSGSFERHLNRMRRKLNKS
ncbi:MAG: PLP-dependent aminotransferase family protein [Clostridia bacterium]|nr:PLP-dependent aminotransferase family protein [Clostridia bacterium]